jgi:hypothetical protein
MWPVLDDTLESRMVTMNSNGDQLQAGSMLPFTATNAHKQLPANHPSPSGQLLQFDPAVTKTAPEARTASAVLVTNAEGVVAVPVAEGAIVIQGSASVEHANQGKLSTFFIIMPRCRIRQATCIYTTSDLSWHADVHVPKSGIYLSVSISSLT